MGDDCGAAPCQQRNAQVFIAAHLRNAIPTRGFEYNPTSAHPAQLRSSAGLIPGSVPALTAPSQTVRRRCPRGC